MTRLFRVNCLTLNDTPPLPPSHTQLSFPRGMLSCKPDHAFPQHFNSWAPPSKVWNWEKCQSQLGQVASIFTDCRCHNKAQIWYCEEVSWWSSCQDAKRIWSKKLKLRSKKLIRLSWISRAVIKKVDQIQLLSWLSGEAMHRQQQVVSWFRLSPQKPHKTCPKNIFSPKTAKTCPKNIFSPKTAQNLSQKYFFLENRSKLTSKIFSPRKPLKSWPKNIFSTQTPQNLSLKYLLRKSTWKLVPKLFSWIISIQLSVQRMISPK